MTLPELIDNLIAASCEEMPDEARKSLDDAIDYIVSSMDDEQLDDLFKMGLSNIEKEDYEHLLMKSILNQNIAFA
jgi:hypothetical protein|tara:strand:- start:2074 stop:2298 length:225 start_codon:yes stop_codon:yes gene_type:complete